MTERLLSTLRSMMTATSPFRQHLSLFGLLLALTAGLQAQTAQFSYAQLTAASGFDAPYGVAVDLSGNLFVANFGGSTIQEVPAGCASISCTATLASGFSGPFGVAVDGSGNVYVADTHNNAVKEILAVGGYVTVNTLGGGFALPYGVAVDATGNVYVADNNHNAVKKIPVGCTTSTCVSTIGGGFYQPQGVAVDGSGNVFVADTGNISVKKVPVGCLTSNCVSTLGSGWLQPTGVAVDGSGNVYVADRGNNAAKVVLATTGAVQSLGVGLSYPSGIAVDAHGNAFVADTSNNRLIELETAGADLGTVAIGQTSAPIPLTFTFSAGGIIGNPVAFTQGSTGLDFAVANGGTCGSGTYSTGATCTVELTFTPQFSGLRNGAVLLEDATGNTVATGYVHGVGTAPQASFVRSNTPGSIGSGFSSPYGVAVEGSGNLIVADTNNNAVKKMIATGGGGYTIETLGGGFKSPSGIAVDGSGNVYVGDVGNNAVKEIAPGCQSSGCVKTLAGGFSSPHGVAVDWSGNVFVADTGIGEVQEIPLGCAQASCVKTLGGGFSEPIGVAVDGSGNIFVGDAGSNAVKEITPGCLSSSCVTTISSGFTSPGGLAVDGIGNVFIADSGTVKEVPVGCVSASCMANLNFGGDICPSGIAVDGGGSVYVADCQLSELLELSSTSSGTVFTTQTQVATIDTNDGAATFTLLNSGNAPLLFQAYFNATPPNAVFSDAALTDCSNYDVISGVGLAPGATCTVSFEFEPQQVGFISGSVSVIDNALNGGPPNYSTQTIPFSGQGIAKTTGSSTLTTLKASPNPAFFGSSVTFTATVTTSGNKTPTGMVTFEDEGVSIGAAPLNNSGIASYTTSGLTQQGHGISAVYGGDANNAGSSSAGLTEMVNLATSNAALAPNANPIAVGASVTFAATITTNGPMTPIGTISFKDGSTTIGTGTLNSSGVATYSTTSLAAGQHSITAVFAGDSYNSASTSPVLTETVNGYTATVTLLPSQNPALLGSLTSFSADVTFTSNQTPTGSVTFKDGSTVLSTKTLSGGYASYATSALALGSHSITVVYSGDAFFASAVSSVLTENVDSTITPTVTVTPSASSITTAQPLTVTVALSGTPTPTGSVKLTGGGYSNTQTLSSRSATFAIAAGALAVGSDTLTASYTPDVSVYGGPY